MSTRPVMERTSSSISETNQSRGTRTQKNLKLVASDTASTLYSGGHTDEWYAQAFGDRWGTWAEIYLEEVFDWIIDFEKRYKNA